MKTFFGLLIAALAVPLLAGDASAQLFGKKNVTQVNVNTNGSPQSVTVKTPAGPLGLRQNTTQVNVGYHQNAFVNSQLLVDPKFRRAQIVNVNTFSYPQNSPANLRFRADRLVYLREQPIVAAPIVEQYTVTQPQTVIQKQYLVQPQGVQGVTQSCPQCQGQQTQPSATDPNYLTQPQQQQQTQACPQNLTQPQAVTLPQQVIVRQVTAPSYNYTLPERILLPQRVVTHQRLFLTEVHHHHHRHHQPPGKLINLPQRLTGPVFSRDRVFVPSRQQLAVSVQTGRGGFLGNRQSVNVRFH